MIDAAAVFAAKSQIQRRHAIMLQKRAVIRPRPKRSNPQIGTRTRFLPHGIVLASSNLAQLRPFPYRHFRFWILHVPLHIIDEFFQRVRTLRAKKSARVHV